MGTYLSYALCVADFKLRRKIKAYDRIIKYSKGTVYEDRDASHELARMIEEGKPFASGRIGLFEMSVMRMHEYHRRNKYQIVMNNLYNCAGFFPNDINYAPKFISLMKKCLGEIDLLAADGDYCENYFINKCSRKDIKVSKSFDLFDVCKLEEDSWSSALKGKRVLVVTPFTESVRHQYENNREKLFQGTDILPEFASFQTYKSLMTIGDMNENGFKDWFEALDFMSEEISKLDFDVAILGCGAYGFPLACRIKDMGKQAIQMGGALQILFGIMGKRWDGTVFGGKMRADVAKYYNEYWTYPIEERPKDASKVEYGPYWK